MLSTAVTAKMAPSIHNKYGLVLMRGTDINDNGLAAFAIYKFGELPGSKRCNQQLGFIGDYAINSAFRQADH
jgi:hypothetical protein